MTALQTKPRYRRGQLLKVLREDLIYNGVVIKVSEINRCWDKWLYVGHCIHYPKNLRHYQNNANRHKWALFEEEPVNTTSDRTELDLKLVC